MKQTIGPVDYSQARTPPGYVCLCGAEQCKLERPHNAEVPEDEDTPLYCGKCRPKGAVLVRAILVRNGTVFYQDGAAPEIAIQWYESLPDNEEP